MVSVSVQTQWMIPFKLWVVDAFFFEKQDEEEKLFTRRLFSNFDRTTMLLSPSFKAIVELYRFFTVSYCGRTPFFRNGENSFLLAKFYAFVCDDLNFYCAFPVRSVMKSQSFRSSRSHSLLPMFDK